MSLQSKVKAENQPNTGDIYENANDQPRGLWEDVDAQQALDDAEQEATELASLEGD